MKIGDKYINCISLTLLFQNFIFKSKYLKLKLNSEHYIYKLLVNINSICIQLKLDN